jgi:hypothetical protein
MGIGPFGRGRLDQPFGLAIGARRVGSGSPMLEAQASAQPGKTLAELAGTIVGEYALGTHA